MNESTLPSPNLFLTDRKGKRVAVVMPLGQYKRLLRVNKRLARLEQLAASYQDMDAALDELRALLAEPLDAVDIHTVLEQLPGEEGR